MPAFHHALARTLADPAAVPGLLFQLRAGQLLGFEERRDGAARLSGLLIGAEIAAARTRHGAIRAVTLIASGVLASLYGAALATAGFAVTQVDAEQARGPWPVPGGAAALEQKGSAMMTDPVPWPQLGRPLVAILRGITPAETPAIVAALVEEGFEAVEIPLNSPDPFVSIAQAVERFGRDCLIGAGTVLTPADCDRLASIGGRLVVSPNTDPAVIDQATAQGLVTMPGIFSPTDAFVAIQSGASALKVFPASVLGPSGIAAIRAVLPPATVIGAVGGVSEANFADYGRAGVRSSASAPACIEPATMRRRCAPGRSEPLPPTTPWPLDDRHREQARGKPVRARIIRALWGAKGPVVAARASWRGFLKVAELTCPVAFMRRRRRPSGSSFHTLNRATGNRVRRQFVDQETGTWSSPTTQVKGYEVGQGEYVVLEPDEIAAAVPESDKTFLVESFSPCDEVDDVYLDRPYYLTPSRRVAQQAFAVIREGMRKRAGGRAGADVAVPTHADRADPAACRPA